MTFMPPTHRLVPLALSLTLLLPGAAFAEKSKEQPAQPDDKYSTANASLADPQLEPMVDVIPTTEPEEVLKKLPQAKETAKDLKDAKNVTTVTTDGGSVSSDSDTSTSLASGEPLKARAVLVDIDSNTLNYDKERDVYVATGAAHVVISEQNSELTADKVTYDQNTGMLIAEGNVVIVKNGQKTEGSYAKIDLTRQSALIHDAFTNVKAVRIKAARSFVNSKYIELENGKFIISGQGMLQLQKTGGLSNYSNATGKGSNQARLNRAYYKEIRDQQAMFSPIDPAAVALQNQKQGPVELNFDDDKKSISRFQLRAKEITIHRGEDGYDAVDMKWPSVYMGKYKLASMPANEFAYDEVNKQFTYLGPDIGANAGYGGAYLGPGWDFRLGKGSMRISPMVSLGDPGFQTTDGKKGEDKGFGPGFGGIAHYRDPDTTIDLAYNSRVGTPVLFADRRLIGDSVHFMAAHNDFYQNGFLGQKERPNYIAQITDYRVLKQFNNFLVTSFESLGYARDNFNPNNSSSYFVAPTSLDPTSAGRLQLQAQIQNIKPLVQLGNHLNFGVRGQVAAHGYTSGDLLGIIRGGPTMNINFNKLRSQVGYFQTASFGQSPFVFDAYIGGSQNLSLNNQLIVNNYLMVGMHQSLNLKKDNARNALAVGNDIYFLVGPQDVKMQIGYDFINKRSHFGIQYYPGGKNTVIGFDKLKLYQPENYSGKSSSPQTAFPVPNNLKTTN